MIFVQVYLGIPARPSEGWSVEILPVRSTVVALARILMEDHAFNPGMTAGECAPFAIPFAGFRADCSGASSAGALRMRSVGLTWAPSELFRNSWKSRSLEKT